MVKDIYIYYIVRLYIVGKRKTKRLRSVPDLRKAEPQHLSAPYVRSRLVPPAGRVAEDLQRGGGGAGRRGGVPLPPPRAANVTLIQDVAMGAARRAL